jgi:ABC-type transport system involved in cytochrome bd biosynthesis fused ATPase/permease subunit
MNVFPQSSKVDIDWRSDATHEEQMLSNEKTQIDRLSRDINARPELAIFGTKQWMVERFAKLSELVAVIKESGRYEYHLEEPPFIHRHLFPLLHSGSRALMYLVVAFQPDYFGMPISQLTFLETSVEGVFSSISYLRQSLSSKLIKDMFRIRNLFECMEIKSAVCPPENPAEYKSNPKGMKIEVKDLTFRYGKEAPPVLKDVNFTVEPGQIVSIVGYNGSGSSPGYESDSRKNNTNSIAHSLGKTYHRQNSHQRRRRRGIRSQDFKSKHVNLIPRFS